MVSRIGFEPNLMKTHNYHRKLFLELKEFFNFEHDLHHFNIFKNILHTIY